MMDWSSERIDRLKALWSEGLPTREIGNRLGITKNAVVGKAHRLGLARRAAPVVRRPEPLHLEVIKLEKLRAGMCSWPEGDPGTPAFRFCGEPTVPDKPYCHEHCKRAYVRSGARAEAELAVA